jgi:hypothetical protein
MASLWLTAVLIESREWMDFAPIRRYSRAFNRRNVDSTAISPRGLAPRSPKIENLRLFMDKRRIDI